VAGGSADDGAAIATANFVTTDVSGNPLAAGRYSETGDHPGYSLAGGSPGDQTELRFELQPQNPATGNAYRFRITDSGSPNGFSYTIYPQAGDILHEQVSWRWADEDETPLEGEDTAYSGAVDKLLHLRIGVRSNNGAWAGHKLSLQYDTNAAFPSPVPFALRHAPLSPGTAPASRQLRRRHSQQLNGTSISEKLRSDTHDIAPWVTYDTWGYFVPTKKGPNNDLPDSPSQRLTRPSSARTGRQCKES